MLNFTVEHITAIDNITGDCDMKMRQYKLSEADWDMAQQLHNVLKVCSMCSYFFNMS